MSILTGQHAPSETGITKRELTVAGVEVLAIFTIFIIAFTGRSTFGEGVKTALTVLSVIVGLAGAVAGVLTIWRGVQFQPSRLTRIVLGGLMTFIGTYTVVHVLS